VSRRHSIRAASVAAVVGTALVVGAVGAPAGAGKGGKRRVEVSDVGTYAVGRIEAVFVDDSRPTPGGGSYPGAPTRTLATTISYPAEGTYVAGEFVDDAPPAKNGSRYPLIVYSHGVTATGDVYQAVINEWVSAGYVVAAPDYPLSNANGPAEPVFTNGVADLGNQPADASFVLDEVLALAKQPGPLRKLIARKHLGAAGHSLGAMTTFGLVYADCCTDARIDAAIPMSGVAAGIDDRENYFTGSDTPLLALHGDADNVLPVQGSLDAFAAASGPKFLVIFPGEGHVFPYVGADGAEGDVLVATTTAFWDSYLKGDSSALDRLRAAVPDPGVATLQEATT
jgi:dienelactone hydrolase